jgi:hypothetical protein
MTYQSSGCGVFGGWEQHWRISRTVMRQRHVECLADSSAGWIAEIDKEDIYKTWWVWLRSRADGLGLNFSKNVKKNRQ